MPDVEYYKRKKSLLAQQYDRKQALLRLAQQEEYWKRGTRSGDRETAEIGRAELPKVKLEISYTKKELRLINAELRDLEATRKKQSAIEAHSLNTLPTRWGFVKPLLEKKGWTKNRWAVMADVKPTTVQNYLDGRKTYPNTLKKLAEALGIEADKLPV